MMKNTKKTILFVLKITAPVFFGYLFLGASFGIMLRGIGYNAIWAFFMSLTVYAGSGQYLLVSCLSQGTALVMVALMTLLVNSRHIFYGLSFLDTFKKTKKAYPYMIFSLTDETYSLLASTKIPSEIDEGRTMFLVALFDQCYWIFGSVIGNLLASWIQTGTGYDFKGVEFAMTALFIVLFLEQFKKVKCKLPALYGFLITGIFLLTLQATPLKEYFLLFSLLLICVLLIVTRGYIEKKEGADFFVTGQENSLNSDFQEENKNKENIQIKGKNIKIKKFKFFEKNRKEKEMGKEENKENEEKIG